MTGRTPTMLALVMITAACGGVAAPEFDVAAAEITEAGHACVDFYRSAAESVEDEPIYHRRLADRIAEAGHDEAARILSDLASQWERGTWSGEGEETEEGMSELYAQAGSYLAEAGAIRCADLAEWWAIDGYEGEPDPAEMLTRQATIWAGNGLEDYFLLVAAGNGGPRLTQIHVEVADGVAASVSVVEIAGVPVSDLPKTIEDLYVRILETRPTINSYDLVYAVPTLMTSPDGAMLFIRVDVEGYPNPIEYFEGTGSAEEEG